MTTSDFSFLIFQPNPSRDIVWYYVDGGSSRNVSKRSSFLEYAEARCIDILPQLKEAVQTYSFYLWDYLDKKVILLHPSEEDVFYKDSVQAVVNSGLKGKDPFVEEDKDPLTSQLYKFGFQAPNDNDVKNLRVELSKQKHQTFFTRLKKIFPTNTKHK